MRNVFTRFGTVSSGNRDKQQRGLLKNQASPIFRKTYLLEGGQSVIDRKTSKKQRSGKGL